MTHILYKGTVGAVQYVHAFLSSNLCYGSFSPLRPSAFSKLLPLLPPSSPPWSADLSVTLHIHLHYLSPLSPPLPPFILPCFSPWALLCLIYPQLQTAVYSQQAAIRGTDHMGGILIAFCWALIVCFSFAFSSFTQEAPCKRALLAAFILFIIQSSRLSRAKLLSFWWKGGWYFSWQSLGHEITWEQDDRCISLLYIFSCWGFFYIQNICCLDQNEASWYFCLRYFRICVYHSTFQHKRTNASEYVTSY